MYNQERAHFRFSRKEYQELLLAVSRRLLALPDVDDYIRERAHGYALAAEHLVPADFYFLDLDDVLSLQGADV